MTKASEKPLVSEPGRLIMNTSVVVVVVVSLALSLFSPPLISVSRGLTISHFIILYKYFSQPKH